MIEVHKRQPLRLPPWCLMRHDWHCVVWPREEREVTGYFRWLAHTHAMRWHMAHHTVGRGHFYRRGLLHTLRREDRPNAVTLRD